MWAATAASYCPSNSQNEISCTIGWEALYMVGQMSENAARALQKKYVCCRRYDAKERTWSLHVDDHDEFLRSVEALKPDVAIERLPSFVVRDQLYKDRSDSQ